MIPMRTYHRCLPCNSPVRMSIVPSLGPPSPPIVLLPIFLPAVPARTLRMHRQHYPPCTLSMHSHSITAGVRTEMNVV